MFGMQWNITSNKLYGFNLICRGSFIVTDARNQMNQMGGYALQSINLSSLNLGKWERLV